MITKYTLARDVGPEDWPTFHRQWKKGEVVYECIKCDYGCARDDLIFADRVTISCTESPTGDYPFFTVPVEFLLQEDGSHPQGEYI